VREVRAVGLPILSPQVDIANVRVEFESGCVANFTASRVSTERVRKLRFFEPRQYVSIDYARQDLLVIRVNEGTVTPAELIASLPPQVASLLPPGIAEGIASGKIDLAKIDPAMIAQFAAMAKIDPALIAQLSSPAESKGGLSFSKPPVTPGEPLRLEILSFMESVRMRREPRVTARQGRDALALALEIQASMAAHAKRAGLENFFNPGA
jgi:hypothetical protein